MTNSNNIIMDACEKLFQLSFAFFEKGKYEIYGTDLPEKIIKEFEIMVMKLKEAKIDDDRIQKIKYALVAYWDELVLRSQWTYKHEWMLQPLQLVYFNEHIAGENFFKYLKDLQQDVYKYKEVIEIYYLCMQFGFEGMYSDKEIEKISALQMELKSQLESVKIGSENTMFLSLNKEEKIIYKINYHMPIWVIISVSLVILLVIYVVFNELIDWQMNRLISLAK